MLDYTTLKFIWWLLLGFLLCGFAVMDGFDLGAVILMPCVTKGDTEKRILINTVGPIWEGNQVWIILGGGAIFAAWPFLYAAAFSGFYLAMFLALVGFILRPVSFKYRSKLPNAAWRHTWDILLTLSGLIPALVFGVAIGNVLQGVPFHFDSFLRFYYTGSFFALFNPFALLCGILSVVMLSMHGATYLCNKTREAIQRRARLASITCAVLSIVLFGAGGLWVQHAVPGYAFIHAVLTNEAANPTHKMMILQKGQWFMNYKHHHDLIFVPALGFLGALGCILCSLFRWFKCAFLSSALSMIGIIATVGVSMFPVLLPSSSTPSQSLLVWDACSSQLTLWLMLLVGIVFFPIIIAYTTWVYRIMRGPVLKSMLDEHTKTMY